MPKETHKPAYDTFGSLILGKSPGPGSGMTGGGGRTTLPLDVRETENEFIVSASLPGVHPEDVEITVAGNVLTIRAESKAEEGKKGEQWHVRERPFGSFQRSLALTVPVDSDKAQARFDQGVLTLNLPKTGASLHHAEHAESQTKDANEARLHKLQDRIDELAGRLEEQARTNDRLRSALIARSGSRLRICEMYEGVVADLNGDRVVVVYDVDGSVVEQTYERSQFLEGRLPEVDTELVAYVVVAEIEPRAAEPEPEEDEHRDEHTSSQRKPLTDPTVF